MILKELEYVVTEQRARGLPDVYLRNVLKEFLQVYVLFFIYTARPYQKSLIFTGGTCLRHFYGLERLSEDVDFDYIGKFSPQEFLQDVLDFFVTRHKYSAVTAALKQQGHQILLKFPVLHRLGLARGSDSDLLYIKVDVAKIPSSHYAVVTTSQSRFGMNYAARHYDLPDLMAGKLHAILSRRYQKGSENRHSIKGRDYFDLLWFLKAGVRPNLRRLSDMLGESIDLTTLEKRVDARVTAFLKHHKSDYAMDMTPLIKEPQILAMYTASYLEEYLRNKERSFRQP